MPLCSKCAGACSHCHVTDWSFRDMCWTVTTNASLYGSTTFCRHGHLTSYKQVVTDSIPGAWNQHCLIIGSRNCPYNLTSEFPRLLNDIKRVTSFKSCCIKIHIIVSYLRKRIILSIVWLWCFENWTTVAVTSRKLFFEPVSLCIHVKFIFENHSLHNYLPI